MKKILSPYIRLSHRGVGLVLLNFSQRHFHKLVYTIWSDNHRRRFPIDQSIFYSFFVCMLAVVVANYIYIIIDNLRAKDIITQTEVIKISYLVKSMTKFLTFFQIIRIEFFAYLYIIIFFSCFRGNWMNIAMFIYPCYCISNFNLNRIWFK